MTVCGLCKHNQIGPRKSLLLWFPFSKTFSSLNLGWREAKAYHQRLHNVYTAYERWLLAGMNRQPDIQRMIEADGGVHSLVCLCVRLHRSPLWSHHHGVGTTVATFPGAMISCSNEPDSISFSLAWNPSTHDPTAQTTNITHERSACIQDDWDVWEAQPPLTPVVKVNPHSDVGVSAPMTPALSVVT